MLKILKVIALPVMGAGVVLAGFVYDVLFAGIPYQDPTPAMQAKWELHSRIANIVMSAGGLCLLAGVGS